MGQEAETQEEQTEGQPLPQGCKEAQTWLTEWQRSHRSRAHGTCQEGCSWAVWLWLEWTIGSWGLLARTRLEEPSSFILICLSSTFSFYWPNWQRKPSVSMERAMEESLRQRP